MASTFYAIRRLGVVLILVGVLLVCWGVYQDYAAPACIDTHEGDVAGGACEEPGLLELFGGVSLALTGIVLVGLAQSLLWRNRIQST
ncbi:MULTISPECIES: hypothetical protein [unclassified Haladaptatus]|uniref:hypothetical protein n=1 Tax=unclassified Haladaptatus TaxID=2622732 RepID=UPI0023E7B9A8|nr:MULTISPECIES: hypothetical protein [unclassified Haladaptatus]